MTNEATTTKIKYGTSEEAWLGYSDFICGLITELRPKQVCEIGGGANPLLDKATITQQGIQYSVMDVSEEELKKAPDLYSKIVADAGSVQFRVDRRFDLVFSKMLIEHIRDAEQFHKNMLSILAPGGLAVHFFPTLYTLPYLINYLATDRLGSILWGLFAPRDQYQHAKFPAYYKWCRGPVLSQIRRFTRLGYEVIEYNGYFGHSGYYQKMGLLKKMHEMKTRYLLRHPFPYCTSYAYVVLKKK